MVIAHEAQVREQRREVLPARERRRVNHQACELAMLLDIRIDGAGERGEVLGAERAFGFEDQDSPFAQYWIMAPVSASGWAAHATTGEIAPAKAEIIRRALPGRCRGGPANRPTPRRD